jgi:hypothetical protein
MPLPPSNLQSHSVGAADQSERRLSRYATQNHYSRRGGRPQLPARVKCALHGGHSQQKQGAPDQPRGLLRVSCSASTLGECLAPVLDV